MCFIIETSWLLWMSVSVLTMGIQMQTPKRTDKKDMSKKVEQGERSFQIKGMEGGSGGGKRWIDCPILHEERRRSNMMRYLIQTICKKHFSNFQIKTLLTKLYEVTKYICKDIAVFSVILSKKLYPLSAPLHSHNIFQKYQWIWILIVGECDAGDWT